VTLQMKTSAGLADTDTDFDLLEASRKMP